MTFDTVHIVRRYGARRLFCYDQLNPHREKRLFYGLPPYSTVRCGAGFPPLEPYGAVRCRFVEAKSNVAVRCG